MFIHYKLDNQIKKFYQNSDIYQKMLSSLEEKDFLDYISLVKYWLPVGSTYLDVGCGTGQGAFYLSQIGYKVTGVDFSARLIDTAKQNFPNINFYQADALQLPFSNNSFDAVGSHCVIEHITDVSKFLAEQIRVVKKGGLIFIYAPNLLSPQLPIKSLLFHHRKTFEGTKRIEELVRIFFRNIRLILKKKMDNRANFIYRQPILTEVWPDYDACYYACPIDIKNFFRNLNCQIVSYQKLDSVKNKKSIFQKIGSLLLPEWMGIIRIVVKK